jgi:hypothetical protein
MRCSEREAGQIQRAQSGSISRRRLHGKAQAGTSNTDGDMGRGDVGHGTNDMGHGTSDMGHGWAHVHARVETGTPAHRQRDAATQQRSSAGPGSWPGLVWPGYAARSAQLHSWLATSLMMRTRGPNGSLTATVCWLRMVQVRVCVCLCLCCLVVSGCDGDCDCDCDCGCPSALVPISSVLMLGWAGLAGWLAGGLARAAVARGPPPSLPSG